MSLGIENVKGFVERVTRKNPKSLQIVKRVRTVAKKKEVSKPGDYMVGRHRKMP